MVTLVVTMGKGSQDLYSQKLAENLDVPKIYTDTYQRCGELFNISFFSRASAKAAFHDFRFMGTLNRLDSVVHLPNQHFGRYGFSLKVPYIITVHDLIRYFDLKGHDVLIHRPNFRDKFYLSLDYKGIEKAIKIIAVSCATKHDLIRYLGIPGERIAVIHEGIGRGTLKPVRIRPLPYPYILYVGSEHPRKNLDGLLQVFARLKQGGDFGDLKLVKVGKAGGREVDFRRETLRIVDGLNLRDEVVFTEWVSDEELAAYYSNAECFVFPSLYEGFGFPPLEAMCWGCPVISSNTSSLPEVVGEAAIRMDPRDIDGLAKAIQKVLTDENLRKKMVQEGFIQAQKFSWERAGRETLKAYQEVEEKLKSNKARKQLSYLAFSFLRGRAGKPKQG
jgi:glycosyltransferase involved in cell wall biosynthesis